MNNTIINYESNFPKKFLSWLITLAILFVPSSAFAWIGIKDDLVLQILLTIVPSIIGLFYFSMKLLIRKLTIEIHINKTFAKYGSFTGNGYYFIELNEQLKKISDKEEKSVAIKPSSFLTDLKVKYHIFSNSLEIITINKTDERDSSISKDNFAFLEFDKDNKKHFNIYYEYIFTSIQCFFIKHP